MIHEYLEAIHYNSCEFFIPFQLDNLLHLFLMNEWQTTLSFQYYLLYLLYSSIRCFIFTWINMIKKLIHKENRTIFNKSLFIRNWGYFCTFLLPAIIMKYLIRLVVEDTVFVFSSSIQLIAKRESSFYPYKTIKH